MRAHLWSLGNIHRLQTRSASLSQLWVTSPSRATLSAEDLKKAEDADGCAVGNAEMNFWPGSHVYRRRVPGEEIKVEV